MSRSRRSTGPSTQGPGEDRSDPRWIEDSFVQVRELSDRVAELSSLMEVSYLLASNQPLPELLDCICQLSAEVAKAQVAFIYLTDGEDDLVCVARSLPDDSGHQYGWEGLSRIYGRKAILDGEFTACPDLLLSKSGSRSDPGSRMGGLCAIPLKGKTRDVGSLVVGFEDTHVFSDRERDMLMAVAAQLAVAVERTWLFDQLQEQLARANSLREVATRIGSNLELDTVLDSILNHATKLLAAEFSAIFLVDQPSCEASLSQGVGGERGHPHGATVQLEECPMGDAVHEAIETARPAIVQGEAESGTIEAGAPVDPKEYEAAMAVPLLSGGEVVGALVVCYLEERRFDPSDVALAQDFAGQAALAIRNARLFEDAMEERHSLEAALNQIYDHGISLMDEELNILFANSATYWMLGASPKTLSLTREEWTALLKRGLVEPDKLEETVERIMKHPNEAVTFKLAARIGSDGIRPLKLLSLPLRQADGSIKGRVNLLEEGV